MTAMPDRVKKRYVKIPKPDENAMTNQECHWHARGYIPHFENWDKVQMVTFRLADALPHDVAERLAHESRDDEGEMAYRRRIESFLDAGHGACWLRQDSIAALLKSDILSYEGHRYHLHAWVIMPNHVHLLLECIAPYSLSKVFKDLKSITSRKINDHLKRTGQVWQEDYWDRYIRNQNHYQKAFEYILKNPFKAGLVKADEDWPWLGCHNLNDESINHNPVDGA